MDAPLAPRPFKFTGREYVLPGSSRFRKIIESTPRELEERFFSYRDNETQKARLEKRAILSLAYVQYLNIAEGDRLISTGRREELLKRWKTHREWPRPNGILVTGSVSAPGSRVNATAGAPLHAPPHKPSTVAQWPSTSGRLEPPPNRAVAPNILRPEENKQPPAPSDSRKEIWHMPSAPNCGLEDVSFQWFFDEFRKINPQSADYTPWDLIITAYKQYVISHFGHNTHKHLSDALTKSRLRDQIPHAILLGHVKRLVQEARGASRGTPENANPFQRSGNQAASRSELESHPSKLVPRSNGQVAPLSNAPESTRDAATRAGGPIIKHENLAADSSHAAFRRDAYESKKRERAPSAEPHDSQPSKMLRFEEPSIQGLVSTAKPPNLSAVAPAPDTSSHSSSAPQAPTARPSRPYSPSFPEFPNLTNGGGDTSRQETGFLPSSSEHEEVAPAFSADPLASDKQVHPAPGQKASRAESNTMGQEPASSRMEPARAQPDSALSRGGVVFAQRAQFPTKAEQSAPKSEPGGSVAPSTARPAGGTGSTPAPSWPRSTSIGNNEHTLSSLVVEETRGSGGARSVALMASYLDEAWEELQGAKAHAPPAGAGEPVGPAGTQCMARLQALLRYARRETANPRDGVRVTLVGLKGCVEDSMGHIDRALRAVDVAWFTDFLQTLGALLDSALQELDKVQALVNVEGQEL